MQTISAWSWENHPESPSLYKNKDIVVVILDNRKVLGFSLTPGIPLDITKSDLNEYELLLFGYDPHNPDRFVVFKNGI